LQIATSSRASYVAATCTSCNAYAQLLEVLRSGLMVILEDDHAELENYLVSNWQPVKIILKCRCYALKVPLPHYESCG